MHEVISLAKVQVKVLSSSLAGGGGEGGGAGDGEPFAASCPPSPGLLAFELWSMARIWRYSVRSEAERERWVHQLQAQVRFLLASFKQRGKSLAFLPENVQLLRKQLKALTEEKQQVEQQVLAHTSEVLRLDEQTHKERGRIAQLERLARRSLCTVDQLDQHLAELAALRQAVRVIVSTLGSRLHIIRPCASKRTIV